MLRFIPVGYSELGAPFDSDNTLNGYFGYDLSDDSKYSGKCVFRLNGYSMEIIHIDAPDSDEETIEGFIRSALNFGGNRNVYIAEFKAEQGISVAISLGFESDNGVLSGDIPTLLKGSCCKGKQV